MKHDATIQYDPSGIGHKWITLDRDEIPANILDELEALLIDADEDSGDTVASNGVHYRWFIMVVDERNGDDY